MTANFFHPGKQLSSVLIKPAGPDCNLNCSYCFYLEKSALFPETKQHRMSNSILEETIRQVMTQGAQMINFGWQGGEPTLMGLEFFRKAVDLQANYGREQTVSNGLQTNGVLIDEEWADFLKEHNFLVGLSLDGPEHVHDHYRFTKGNKGSWAQVMKSAHTMLDAGVAVNALTVVNDYSAQYAEEIYNSHKSHGLNYMQFIPCVETDPGNPTVAAPFSVSAEAYGDFLTRIFDLWMQDFKNGLPTTFVRFIDSVFHSYVDINPPECTLLHTCGQYVVVEHNGDVYSCDFYVAPDWKLGNVTEGSLSEMLNSERQTQFGLMKAKLPRECLNCPWVRYCRGGCTKDRIKDPRDRELNHFCASYKMFFEHAHPRMSRLAENWKIQQEALARREEILMAIQQRKITIDRNDPCPCGSGKKFKKCCGSENTRGLA